VDPHDQPKRDPEPLLAQFMDPYAPYIPAAQFFSQTLTHILASFNREEEMARALLGDRV
jgi:hypothetical protein